MKEYLEGIAGMAVLFVIAMHGIAYGVEVNGGAHKWNPAWRLLQGYFELEKIVLILAVILGLVFVFILWLGGTQDTREYDRLRIERKLNEPQWAHRKKELEEEAAARAQYNRDRVIESLPLNTPVTKQEIKSEIPAPKKPSAQELREKAIKQFLK